MRNRTFQFLFAAAGEETAGGGASATAATPETQAAAADANAAEATGAAGAAEASAEPTLLQKVSAAVKSKGAMLADNARLTAERDGFEARATAAEAELATLRAENARLTGERAEIETALQTATESAQTVEAAAASQVAALGFVAKDLPGAAAEVVETRDGLEAQLRKETDPAKRWEINEKLFAMD